MEWVRKQNLEKWHEPILTLNSPNAVPDCLSMAHIFNHYCKLTFTPFIWTTSCLHGTKYILKHKLVKEMNNWMALNLLLKLAICAVLVKP